MDRNVIDIVEDYSSSFYVSSVVIRESLTKCQALAFCSYPCRTEKGT
jgi:hypothetical protein